MPRRPAMGATLTAPAVDRPGALRRRMHPPVVAGGAGAARPAQRRRRVLKAWRIALWALLTSLGPAAGAQQAAAPGALVEAGPEGPRTGPGWRLAALPRQDIAATRYSAERTPDAAAPGGQLLALRIDADRSYGNWVHELPGLDLPARLRWRWRVRQANSAVDLASKPGDDSPAKVCLSFDWPLQRVPFFERQLLRLARSQTGQDLPAATLCWVWGGAEAVGTALDNPYSRRVRVIVLRNATQAGERWFDEDRDVAADLRRSFGDELGQAALPAVTALIVAGDADNTGATSVAHVAGLQWVPRAPP